MSCKISGGRSGNQLRIRGEAQDGVDHRGNKDLLLRVQQALTDDMVQERQDDQYHVSPVRYTIALDEANLVYTSYATRPP